MAALEAAVLSIFSHYTSSSKSFLCSKPLPLSLRLHFHNSTPALLSHHFFVSPLNNTRKLCLVTSCSTLQDVAVESEPEATQQLNVKRKLFVLNLPWSFSVADMKNLFGECGTVKDVEIIKNKDGKSRGFAFVTMASGEEAQAVVDKFGSHEVSGRTIRVEFAKRFKRPSPPPPSGLPTRETRYKLYVSNLAWKVRSTHLREFFSGSFSLVSARVVFDGPSGKSGGYGFVSFATKEEAEAAVSALDGKELLGRPVRLKFSEKNDDKSGGQKEEEEENASVSQLEGS